MTYAKTNWQDRVVEKPRTYSIINNPDGTITLTPQPGVITQEGTPINASNLNNIEQGIADVNEALEEHLSEIEILSPKAGSTANAILLELVLIDKKKGSFLATAANTGNMTINGKAFKKDASTQISVGGVKVGKVYDFYYDLLSDSVFILAKATGNAQPSHVLAPYTFSNDDGEKVGTLTKACTPITCDFLVSNILTENYSTTTHVTLFYENYLFGDVNRGKSWSYQYAIYVYDSATSTRYKVGDITTDNWGSDNRLACNSDNDIFCVMNGYTRRASLALGVIWTNSAIPLTSMILFYEALDKSLIATNGATLITKLKYSDGTLDWQQTLPATIISIVADKINNVYYVPCTDGKVYKVSSVGVILATLISSAITGSGPACAKVHNGYLYLVYGSNVYKIDLTTGTRIWLVTLPEGISSRNGFSIDAKGVLFVTSLASIFMISNNGVLLDTCVTKPALPNNADLTNFLAIKASYDTEGNPSNLTLAGKSTYGNGAQKLAPYSYYRQIL